MLESLAADITAHEILNPDRARHIRVVAPATTYVKRTLTIFTWKAPRDLQARDRHTECSPLQIHSIHEERKPTAKALTTTRMREMKRETACVKDKR
jgi:hypothetical protein